MLDHESSFYLLLLKFDGKEKILFHYPRMYYGPKCVCLYCFSDFWNDMGQDQGHVALPADNTYFVMYMFFHKSGFY